MDSYDNKLDKTNALLTVILKVLAIIALLAFLCICAYKYVYSPCMISQAEKQAEYEVSKNQARLLEQANETAKSTPALTVFFDRNTPEERISEIGQSISQRPGVEKIVFVSAEQAWNNYKEEYLGEYADTFGNDDQQDFGPYYEVYVNDVTVINDLSRHISSIDAVREIHSSGKLNDYQHQLKEID